MRVIAGSARGRPLKVPPGKTTRPTSDRVREALFGMLEALPLAWDRVLDLYAGSGALGIEALSRGAQAADFVESARAACAVIRDNLTATGFSERARVFCRPVERALPDLTGQYDIILLDPPYADPGRDNLLRNLGCSALLTDRTVVVVEHSRRHPVAESYGQVHLIKQRRYGDTVISIFQQGNRESRLDDCDLRGQL